MRLSRPSLFAGVGIVVLGAGMAALGPPAPTPAADETAPPPGPATALEETSSPIAPVRRASARTAEVVVQVFKSPTCGCCVAWVDHLREHGYEVQVEDVSDLAAVKAMTGVPADLRSCHTAVVEGYVVEGHVPAADIDRLLADRPELAGLAVPGMPVGSPGMEVPGRAPDAYEVLGYRTDGTTTVFARH